MSVKGFSVSCMQDLKEWNISTFKNIYKGFFIHLRQDVPLLSTKIALFVCFLEAFHYIMITGNTHWSMPVSKCMVECLSFYKFLLILYSQGSIVWSLECLIALFLNPESWSSSHYSWFKCQQTKTQYNTRATH